MKTTRTIGLGAILAVAPAMFGACRDRQPPPGPSPTAPVRYAKFLPPVSARVRVIVPELGPGWRVGIFNRTRQEPPCYLVLIYDPGHTMTIAVTAYAASIARMQVSTLYGGDTAADRDPAAAAYEGEQWLDASLDSATHTGRSCPQRIERAR